MDTWHIIIFFLFFRFRFSWWFWWLPHSHPCHEISARLGSWVSDKFYLLIDHTWKMIAKPKSSRNTIIGPFSAHDSLNLNIECATFTVGTYTLMRTFLLSFVCLLLTLLECGLGSQWYSEQIVLAKRHFGHLLYTFDAIAILYFDLKSNE